MFRLAVALVATYGTLLSPAGPFAKLTDPLARLRLTKRLIFSNWRVVPKAVATLLSYEVERRQFPVLPEPQTPILR